MTQRTQAARRKIANTRMRIALAIFAVLFLLFATRLFQIQGVDASQYVKLAAESGTETIDVPAPRGDIVDRNGQLLASSVDVLALTADPTMTSSHAPQIARLITEKLGSNEVDYFDLIDKLRTPKTHFVYLVKSLEPTMASSIVQSINAAGLTGVFTEKSTQRVYPGGVVAGNVVGFTDAEGNGVAGLEAMFNNSLAGRNGKSTYEVSPTGQRIPLADDQVTPMVPGKTVKTTIDRDLQWYGDQQLSNVVQSSGADWGLAITMDVRTCQIVQMSQAPTFTDATSSRTPTNTVNRAISTVYEPGSVMKVVTMAALADQGKITADSQITVPSQTTIDGFNIHDYWEHGELHLTAAGVIAQSSNLGTLEAAKQMDDQTFYNYLTKFGFGRPTGIEQPAETGGILAAPKDWTAAKHATVSFGQGVSVNAVQMVRAVGAIANGGTMCKPTLIDDGSTSPTTQVVSKAAASQVTRMMEAVTADNGTAPLAQIPGYRVAGKTGTAWRVDPNTGRYVSGQNTVSFMGFAPADNPRFVTYVVIDKPPSSAGGGSLAGPVFAKIMSAALQRFGVPPTGAPSPVVPQTW